MLVPGLSAALIELYRDYHQANPGAWWGVPSKINRAGWTACRVRQALRELHHIAAIPRTGKWRRLRTNDLW